MPERDFSLLVAAMAVSKIYRLEVLDTQTRPSALATGYEGRHFNFTDEELGSILNVDVKSFAEFGAALDKIKEELNPQSKSSPRP